MRRPPRRLPIKSSVCCSTSSMRSRLRPARSGAPVARLVLALPVQGPRGARWVLAVELSLRSLQERFEKVRPTEGSAFLVDSGYRAVIHPDPNLAFSRADLSKHLLLSGVEQED